MEDHFFVFAVSVARLNKLVQKLKTRGMALLDMKAAHTMCMYHLMGAREGLTFSELVQGCDLDQALVSRVLAGCGEIRKDPSGEQGGMKVDLTEKGMVRKDGLPGKYNARYCLTEQGTAVARQIAVWVSRVQERANVGIDPEDLKVFYRVLRRLLANFEAMVKQPETLFQ